MSADRELTAASAPHSSSLKPTARSLTDRVAGPVYSMLHFIGEFTTVLVKGLVPGRWRRTMRAEFGFYLFQVGVRAIPAVMVTAALVGVGLVMQIVYWLSLAGQSDRIGEFLVLILVRQVAPTVTALVIIGRSGSVLVDEIGERSVSGQLRALRSQGIDPVDFITIPRSFAFAIASLLLSILFMHVALWSGFVAASLGGFRESSVLDQVIAVFGSMSPNDHLLLIIKPLLVGYLVGYISIWLGMRVEHGHENVRRALPKAFVVSLLATFAVGTLISAIL